MHEGGKRVRCKALGLHGIYIAYITYAIGGVRAHGVSTSSVELAVLDRRQDPPSPVLTALLPASSPSTSSSFDYWWPYPPASSQDPSSLLSSTATSTDDGGGPSSSDLGPYIFASLTSTLLSAYASTTSSSVTPDSTSSTLANANVTNVNSYSIISITALPPLNTTTVKPHGTHVITGHHKPPSVAALSSIFAVLGAGLGAVFGWWFYGVYKARNRKLAGPRYSGVNHNEDDEKDRAAIKPCVAGSTLSNESEALLYNKPIYDIPSTKNFQDGSRGVCEPPVPATSAKDWTDFALDVLKSPFLTRHSSGQKNKSFLSEKRAHDIQDEISAASVVDRNGGVPQDVELEENKIGLDDCTSPYAPTVFGSVATSDEDDYEQARYADLGRNGAGTTRNKSIRKRLADKLQYFGFKSSVAHRGEQRRGRTPEMEEGVLLQSDAESVQGSPVGLRKTKWSAPRGRYSHGRAISDFSLTNANIQAPAATHTRNLHQSSPKRNGMGVMDAVRSYTSPLRPSSSDDKFTELPKRNRTTRRLKTSRRPATRKRSSPTKTDDGHVEDIGQKENLFILPASPPTVSSPQLESDLFFSPALPATNSPDYNSSRQRIQNLREASESPTRFRTQRDHQSRSGISSPRRMVKEASGLASYREKALPPSPPRRTSRRCLSNSPTKHKSRALDKQRERSGTVPARPMSPKERYEARHSALDRVDAIVSQSWSARNVRGISAPSSPTMFGAQVDDGKLEGRFKSSGLMMSIEQILDN